MRGREFTTAPPRPGTEDERDAAPPAGTHDPLRFCVFTTVALIAWVAGPPVAVLLTSALGIVAYWRARRDGVLRSRCVLGDTRLVLLYLGTVCLLAAGALARRVLGGG